MRGNILATENQQAIINDVIDEKRVFLISTISRRLFQQSEDIKFRRSISNAFL